MPRASRGQPTVAIDSNLNASDEKYVWAQVHMNVLLTYDHYLSYLCFSTLLIFAISLSLCCLFLLLSILDLLSLFDRALKNNFPSSLLRIQYRMRPELSFWPNMQFYDGKLIDGEIVLSESYRKYFHEKGIPPLSMLDVTGKEEKIDGSFISHAEIHVALCMVRQASILALEERAKNHLEFKPIVVGIITPYSAQRMEIERRLNMMNCDESILQVKCRTVDGFQGQECDIILFSAVRSAGIGFLDDYRRLNVAITRAKYSLLIIGDCANLKKDEKWRSLIEHASRHHCLHSASSGTFMSQHIVTAVENLANETRRLETLKKPNSSLVKNSIWRDRVNLMQSFQTSFQKVTDYQERVRVLDQVIKLSNGKWRSSTTSSSKNNDPLLLRDIVYTVPMQRNVLVWSIGLKERPKGDGKGSDEWTQVIQIWDFVSPHELQRLKDRIESVHSGYSDEHIARLRQRGCVHATRPVLYLIAYF